MNSKLLLTSLSFVISVYAADGNLSPVAKSFDSQLTYLEREFVSLVEAMPADKFSFAPKQGAVEGVRTFAQQATHVATVNYMIAAALLGEKSPVDKGQNENGPADIKSKEQIVAFLKKSFAYTHKALGTLTAENLMGEVQNPFGANKVPRLNVATEPQWHGFDHYGQMVVYARMSGIVPPGSRPQPKK